MEQDTITGVINGVRYSITKELFNELKEKYPASWQISLIEKEIIARGKKED